MERRTAEITRWDAIWFVASAIVVNEILGGVGASALPQISGFCAIALAAAIRMCWPLRYRKWFVPFFLIMTLMHVPVAIATSLIKITGFYLIMVPLVAMDTFSMVSLALKIDDRNGS